MRTTLAVTLLCVIGGVARADFASGRDKLIAGDYKAAIADLSKVTGKDRAAARIRLAEAQAIVGDYAAAEATVTPIAQGKDPLAVTAHLTLDAIRRSTGRGADARKDLEDLATAHSDDRAVRTALAELRHAQGDLVGAKALFETTIREDNAKKLDYDKADQLFELAQAERYTERFQDANVSYRAALKVEPGFAAAGIAWADLFSQKYASDLAAQTIEEIFKVNPNDPEAPAAMAGIISDTSYDLPAIHHHLDAALAVNPKHARALRVRASLEIDQSQWDTANKTLDQVLAVDKEDVEALAMKATIAWLRDDLKEFDAERAKAFAVDPAYAELYRIVSRSAVREHRYVEAIDLEKEAIKLKPDFFEAMAGAGLGYLRLGMEKRASHGSTRPIRVMATTSAPRTR